MKKLLLPILGLFLFITSCEKDDPDIPNEEELITTVRYQLTPAGGGTMVELSYTDLDGDGGNAPVIVNGVLDANTTYTGNMILLNEQESPAEDIAEEVLEEGVDHQFFFTSTSTDLSVAYADQDNNGDAIGLASTVTTLAAGNAELTIVLRHEPNKAASGVAGGDITNAGGETDIEVTFDVTIQ